MFSDIYTGMGTLNKTPYITQNWGEGGTAHEIVVRCSNWGGDTAQKDRTDKKGRGT